MIFFAEEQDPLGGVPLINRAHRVLPFGRFHKLILGQLWAFFRAGHTGTLNVLSIHSTMSAWTTFGSKPAPVILPLPFTPVGVPDAISRPRTGQAQ